MACTGKLSDGVLPILADSAIKIIALVPLVFLWRALAAQGADLGGLRLAQLLSYSCLAIMLERLLNVRTFASDWNYDGQLGDLFHQPLPVFWQIIARTAGTWLPELALFSLPMALLLPLLGVDMLPKTLWFFPSLLLTISLGFAVDCLFVCVSIRIQHASYIVHSLRFSLIALLSGALIPFNLLPFSLGKVLEWLPFGSMAAAPLSLFVGAGNTASLLAAQLLWNALLWPLAALCFAKSRERMVSYGG
jgi:ABC-2 type transport system permease protein